MVVAERKLKLQNVVVLIPELKEVPVEVTKREEKLTVCKQNIGAEIKGILEVQR